MGQQRGQAPRLRAWGLVADQQQGGLLVIGMLVPHGDKVGGVVVLEQPRPAEQLAFHLVCGAGKVGDAPQTREVVNLAEQVGAGEDDLGGVRVAGAEQAGDDGAGGLLGVGAGNGDGAIGDQVDGQLLAVAFGDDDAAGWLVCRSLGTKGGCGGS